MTALVERGALIVSPQVLNEFYAVAIRRSSLIPEKDARRLISAAQDWCLAETNFGTTIGAIDLRARTGYQWFDCLLLASARDAGCAFFISEDMQHDHVIDGVRIVNPFISDPRSVLQTT